MASIFFFVFTGAVPVGSGEIQENPHPEGLQLEMVKEGSTIGEAFANEELNYNIGFWFFDDVAEGKLTIKRGEGGEYIATLAAHTTGFVHKLVKRRKDLYVAHLKEIDGGKRFITISFEKDVDNGGKIRKSINTFDYARNVVKWKKWGNDGKEESGEIPLPKGIWCDDPIAAFYNFRYGVYGPIREGKEYKIYTIPKEDRVPEIYLRITDRKEKEKRFKGEKAEYLALAKIDKELFGSKSGEIEILFSDDMVPTQAVAKDIMAFGDVKGKLTEIGTAVSFTKRAPALQSDVNR